MISLSFCTAPVSSIVAESLVAEVRVYCNTGETVELKLSDCPRTFCPRINTFTQN